MVNLISTPSVSWHHIEAIVLTSSWSLPAEFRQLIMITLLIQWLLPKPRHRPTMLMHHMNPGMVTLHKITQTTIGIRLPQHPRTQSCHRLWTIDCDFQSERRTHSTQPKTTIMLNVKCAKIALSTIQLRCCDTGNHCSHFIPNIYIPLSFT